MSCPYDTDRSTEVTKVSIVLKDTADWRNWYQYQKQLAGAKGIWKYADPDGSDEFYTANKEPSEPSLEKYAKTENNRRKTAAASAAAAAADAAQRTQDDGEGDTPPINTPDPIEYSDLKEKEREVYKEAMALWEKRLANFKTLKKAYEGFSLQILGTIATEHLFMIILEISPRRQIQILRDRFSPGEWDRHEQLRVRYDALKKRPKNANIESWLDNWISTCMEGKEADSPTFLRDNPQRDFI
ncbi:hypothetical protein EJ04DRAFT_57984 [Polyplosphaeria fusca]|uniref:Uncharacterized protein n=1 Tax=Polyplosphaeria fusca TaxID=682080 RepID=A0A9P4UYG7_9PLEO|nr:hypothetical protein EJ04DRAFT_57984 [Polyplosphaeria fusca]